MSTTIRPSYGLWLVVDWYDFLVIDILLAPFDKFYKASGISAFDENAVLFHLKGSLRGTVLGIIFAPLAGLLVTFLKGENYEEGLFQPGE